jgi:hypothetical protein
LNKRDDDCKRDDDEEDDGRRVDLEFLFSSKSE